MVSNMHKGGVAAADRSVALAVDHSPKVTSLITQKGFRPGPGLGRKTLPLPKRSATVLEEKIARHTFTELDIEFDAERKILRYDMKPLGRPCATVGLMEEIRALQKIIVECFNENTAIDGPPLKYLVLGSKVPGIFNLGGNLELFSELIAKQDRSGLEYYAKLSVDVIHANSMALNLPIVTISLVQGDALGGGFEAALCSNVLIAERSSKFGLPEILFGLFPGMGAYSFLSRRIGPKAAEEMIFSGTIYTAEELHEAKVVDVIAEDDFGEEALIEYVGRNQHRLNAHHAIYRARQVVTPVSYQEMLDVAMIWVDAAMNMAPADIRKMNRLASAQDRRTARAD